MPEPGWLLLAVIGVSAILTGILHGSTGMAGGIVMAAILSHLIGIKAAVPAMAVALILSHLSRAVLYARNIDWATTRTILAFGCPTIVLGALIFGRISPTTVAVVFAAFLSISIPVRHWARRHSVRTGPKTMAAASSVWGILAGNVIGPGFFLAPFLLGTGMNRMTYVGTLATVTLAMNVVKMTVFGATGLLSMDLFLVGAAIGLLSVPGNWIGRSILRGMSDSDHRFAIEIMTVLMIVNFVYLAVNPG
jgi:uncharacterized membrane protein YfcA